MKLGIVSDEIDRDFARAVRIGTSLGIYRYEIRNLTTGRAPFCDPAELREVERIASGEGIEITALSPGLFKYTEDRPGLEKDLAEAYPRACELAQRWKLPRLIVFGFHKPGITEENFASKDPGPIPDHLIDWWRRAGDRAEADGMLLMIEPEPICWVDTASVVARLIAASGSKALRINYDPGNVAWLQGCDPFLDFAPAAHWIANVHVKDLRPGPEFVPAGEGLIDFARHFQALRQSGYSGPISLEPHMDGNVETIRRCKEAFEKAWLPDPTPPSAKPPAPTEPRA
jgi:sugar phosphate isomerase/epimerase